MVAWSTLATVASLYAATRVAWNLWEGRRVAELHRRPRSHLRSRGVVVLRGRALRAEHRVFEKFVANKLEKLIQRGWRSLMKAAGRHFGQHTETSERAEPEEEDRL
jgi:hypothetical protein